MAGCLLEPEEKRRFTEWLEMRVYSSTGMVEQFEKMHVPEALIQKEKVEMEACKIVINMINSGEDVSVSG